MANAKQVAAESYMLKEEEKSIHQCLPRSGKQRKNFLRKISIALPVKIQNRVLALKKLQVDQMKLQAEFYGELHKLEKEYHEKKSPFLQKRTNIIQGKLEPGYEAQEWPKKKCFPLIDDKNKPSAELIAKYLKDFDYLTSNVAGIPEFWLTILNNVNNTSNLIRDVDVPVLKRLKDIKVAYNNDQSFTLEFHFDENEYFTNQYLTKTYHFLSKVNDAESFDFNSRTIHKCIGCTIDWKANKNIIEKLSETQSDKGISAMKPTSFFNFFHSFCTEDDLSDEERDALENDFEAGNLLRTEIVPKAILYFTGELGDSENELSDSDESESDDSTCSPNCEDLCNNQ